MIPNVLLPLVVSLFVSFFRLRLFTFNTLSSVSPAADIADFLHKGEGLNKRAIGDYLGERADFNQAVLASFVTLHDFSDLILVQALRQFLWSFRLPGESQKIDRMMECFAKRYCELNPDIFTSAGEWDGGREGCLIERGK